MALLPGYQSIYEGILQEKNEGLENGAAIVLL